MAKQTTVVLVDDLDGTQADETIDFGFEGRRYQIDLSTANAATLRDLIGPFVASARRTRTVPSARRAGPTGPAKVDREQNQAIRAWARGQGMTVNERGRIPAEIIEKFQAAH